MKQSCSVTRRKEDGDLIDLKKISLKSGQGLKFFKLKLLFLFQIHVTNLNIRILRYSNYKMKNIMKNIIYHMKYHIS